jgi:probable phosphoglycerate mutase
MLTLHLVRHGDTAQAAEGIFSGDIDPPLTPAGIAQAEKLTRATAKLGLDALYVSPKLRAHMTIEPTARVTKLTPTEDAGFKEIGYGRWEGEREVDVRARERALFDAWVADPGLVSPPGGETGFEIAARAMQAIFRIRERHPNGQVLVVSHKATIRVVTCALLGIYIGRFRDRINCPTASITTFELTERGPMLVRLADTAHLL